MKTPTIEAKKAATLENEGSKTTQTKQKALDNKEINISISNPKLIIKTKAHQSLDIKLR
ncbi:hypothetical protein [Vreelandella venusta]|uniref:hypothetical protein n=1 Tax=Vreelandella venusta TaxID=44935 RepID=UPI0014957B7A|nr:hypothetical protein [Halomonas venusta]